MRTTRTHVLAAAAALALLLAGCGDSDPTATGTPTSTSSYGPAATGAHNADDVAFSAGMIPHHAQAVEMAELALSRATNAEVKALATAIRGAQAPEIAMMSGWLAGWGEQVPSGTDTSMGHGSHGMPSGMMSEQQMADLEKATGAAFDRLWVQMMIEHHEGAVAMAKTELADGQNAEAKQLAQAIITAQEREIATMKGLLKTLPA